MNKEKSYQTPRVQTYGKLEEMTKGTISGSEEYPEYQRKHHGLTTTEPALAFHIDLDDRINEGDEPEYIVVEEPAADQNSGVASPLPKQLAKPSLDILS